MIVDPSTRYTKSAIESIAAQMKDGWFDPAGKWHKGQKPESVEGVPVERTDIVKTNGHCTIHMLLADERMFQTAPFLLAEER